MATTHDVIHLYPRPILILPMTTRDPSHYVFDSDEEAEDRASQTWRYADRMDIDTSPTIKHQPQQILLPPLVDVSMWNGGEMCRFGAVQQSHIEGISTVPVKVKSRKSKKKRMFVNPHGGNRIVGNTSEVSTAANQGGPISRLKRRKKEPAILSAQSEKGQRTSTTGKRAHRKKGMNSGKDNDDNDDDDDDTQSVASRASMRVRIDMERGKRSRVRSASIFRSEVKNTRDDRGTAPPHPTKTKIQDCDRNTPIEMQKPNPKRPGSKAHGRYEKYMVATTKGELFDLGGSGDWLNDRLHGYVTILTG